MPSKVLSYCAAIVLLLGGACSDDNTQSGADATGSRDTGQQNDGPPPSADGGVDAAASDGPATDGVVADLTPAADGGVIGGWVKITKGSFSMGAPAASVCAETNESQHLVNLTHDFEIHSTETTQAQFSSAMGYNPAAFATCGTSCPVEQVTWNEAAAYCNKLSADKGLTACYSCTGAGDAVNCAIEAAYAGANIYGCPGYRLPTEAEWEFAYRAGTSTPLYSGAADGSKCGSCPNAGGADGGPGPDQGVIVDTNADKIAWYCPNAGGGPHPAGTKAGNAFGIFDMAGNVWEWINDLYMDDLGTTTVTDPAGATAGAERVLRGGSVFDPLSNIRASSRDSFEPTKKDVAVGFRCARSL